MKNCSIWWNLYKLRNFETSNLAKSEYLPFCTIVYCGLDCKVSIAQSIFCLTAERTSLYNDWSLKMPGFFLVDFISTHSGQFFTLVHKCRNQFENWISSWIKQKWINSNLGTQSLIMRKSLLLTISSDNLIRNSTWQYSCLLCTLF